MNESLTDLTHKHKQTPSPHPKKIEAIWEFVSDDDADASVLRAFEMIFREDTHLSRREDDLTEPLWRTRIR